MKNVRCVEDDRQSRIINILVTNNGEAYPLDLATMTARYKIHKPDHTYIYNNAKINNDGTVTISLPDQAMTVPGILYSALQLSKNGVIISTMPFNIIVEKSVYSNKDIESQNESDVISDMIGHLVDFNNPHQTTKAQVGLGNADNTSDIDKPISIAQQAALDKKLDKTTVADSSVLGLVKSGTDITVDADGNVSVNDNSHNHTASNISDLSDFSQTEISKHNTSAAAHYDIREFISELNTRLNALADSDDTTLDQLSEIVAYIKSNRSLIENITTSKINVSDIVDYLTSSAADKPLSANQGKVLNDLIAALTTIVGNKVDQVSGKDLSSNDYTTEEKNKLNGIASGAEVNVQADWSITDSESDAYIKNKPVIPTKTSELINDSGFTDNYTHPDIDTATNPNGLYKIATDENGHVTEAVSVSKEDITALGIPAQDTNTWRGIQNNLISASTTDSLSAAQGKVLKGLVDGHTHSYLPLTGGTMSGLLKMNGSTYYIDTTYGNGKFNQVLASDLIDLGKTGIIQLGNGVYSFDHTGSINCSNIMVGGTVTVGGATTVKNNFYTYHAYTRTLSNGGNKNPGNSLYHPIVTLPGSDNRAVNYINSNSGTPYSVTINGQWGASSYASHNITSSSSDIRLKENISDTMEYGLKMISKIRVRQFDWKESGEHQKIGFIADELEAIDDHFAFGGGYEEDGSMNVKSVDTFYMMGYVVKGMQELSAWKTKAEKQIIDLKKENEELKNRILNLESKIS